MRVIKIPAKCVSAKVEDDGVIKDFGADVFGLLAGWGGRGEGGGVIVKGLRTTLDLLSEACLNGHVGCRCRVHTSLPASLSMLGLQQEPHSSKAHVEHNFSYSGVEGTLDGSEYIVEGHLEQNVLVSHTSRTTFYDIR